MAKPALNLAALTNEEKLELIDDLWTSIDFGAWALTPEQREELDLRLDRLEKEGARRSIVGRGSCGDDQ